jgi:hypothetical protein
MIAYGKVIPVKGFSTFKPLVSSYRHSGLLLENGAENPSHNLSLDFQISDSFPECLYQRQQRLLERVKKKSL